MAQDLWTLQGKSSQKPAHGPPLQARVVAANRTVLQLANCWFDPGAHGNEQGGQIKTERGNNDEGSRHDMAKVDRQGMAKVDRQNKPAAGKHSRQTIQPAQASQHNSQPADEVGRPRTKTTADEVGRPRSKTTAAEVGRPLAAQCRLVEGARWCWHSKGGLRPTQLFPSQPIAFACHCPYPLP